jgi:hypothetical protein
MDDTTLSGFGDNIFAGSISADRIAYNDAVGFYDPKSLTNQNRLTNADRIRALSDEELAEYLSKVQGDIFRGKMRLTHQWLDWLRQEVDDG